MKRIKKFLTILLTIAMVVSLLPATAFAANNTATTMRLAKTQGTVAVTNATGKNVKQTGNMKLYNGYKVKTGAKSYAWISLDDTKVAKLDANSAMEVQKKGKSLTLYLSSGNMFFNVKDPLKSGESFNIKTSTMTTGIRGTSGCVRVISDRVTEIHLLTGQVQIYTEHPALGVSKSAVLQAGQKATSLIDWEAEAVSGEMAEIVIEQLENHEICGVCSKEIAEDPELLERIKEEAPHLLPEQAAAEADERLAADEAKAEEKQAAIDKAVEEQVFPEDVDPYFEEVPSTGGSSGGGSSAVTPSSIVEVATWGELVQAVSDYNDGIGTTEIRLTADIAAGTNDDGLEPIGNQGPLTLNLGTNELKLNGTLVNEGNLTITNTAGYLALLDTVIGQDTTPVVVQNTGHLILQNGTIVLNEDIGVHNSGIFDMTGGAIRCGTVTTTDGTSNFTSAVMPNGVGVYNSGIVNISGGMIEAATGIDDETQAADGSYNVTISGEAVVKGLSTPNMTGSAMNLRGRAKISGGTISGGITVPAGAVLDMTAGTITAAGSVRGIYVNGGTANISGGEISAENGEYGIYMQNGTAELSGGKITSSVANIGAITENAVGVAVYGGALTLNGTIIQANGGDGMQLNGGMTTFTSGTVTAATNATAVEAYSTDYFNDTITATIRAAEDTGVFNIWVEDELTWPEGYTVVQEGTYFVLKEATGGGGTDEPVTPPEEEPDTPIEVPGLTTWAQFVEAVNEFNNASTAQTIRLDAPITPSDEEAAAATLAAIGATGATSGTENNSLLTIDLNNNALTLPQTMINEGNLKITGGSISSTKATTLIQNNGGTVELATGARVNLTLGQTAVANANGTVNMTTGSTVQLNNVSSKGIFSEGGTVEMSGGEIFIVGATTGTGNRGIDAVNTAVTLSGGTIRETASMENNTNYGIYASGGTLNLTSGSITMNHGTAVGVSTKSIMTLDTAVVKGMDYDRLLTAADNDTAGYVANPSADNYYVLEKSTATTISGEEAFYNAVRDFATATENVTLTLDANLDFTTAEENPATGFNPATATMTVNNANQVLTVDLAGHSLKLATTLTNNGKLHITNSGSTSTAALTTTAANPIINNTGQLTLGQFAVTPADQSAQAVVNSGTLVVNGTTFNTRTNGASGIVNTGTTTIEAGTFYANNGDSSGQAINSSSGTLTMNGGSIASEGRYDSIKVSGGTFNMTGGSITTNAYMAAAISLSGSAKANISGGTITANDNGGEERGIYVARGATLNMTGGTINVKTTSGNNSGGILAAANSTVNIIGGIINATTAGGYALRVFNSTNTDWSSINLTVDVDNATIQATTAATVISPDTHPDYKGYEVLNASGAGTGVYKLGIRNGVGTAQELYNAIQAFNAGTTDDTINLLADIDFADEPDVGALVVNNVNDAVLTLNLDAYDLTLTDTMLTHTDVILAGKGTITATGDIITNAQAAGSNFIPELTLNGPTLNVTSGWAVNNAGYNDVSGNNLNPGTVFMDGGAIIIDANASGGINAINSQTTINGGMITNNSRGSAVAGGTVTMNGGSIDVNGGYGITSVTETFVEEEDGSQTQIVNIALNSGTITVSGGTGVYLNLGMAALEGVDITVTSGIGVQNDNAGIVVMGNTAIHVSTFSTGVRGGTLYMNNDNSVIDVGGTGSIGTDVQLLEMTGGRINVLAENAVGIYAEGAREIYLLSSGSNALPTVTAESETATAIMVKPSTDENGNPVAYPGVVMQANEEIVFAKTQAGLINADFLIYNGNFEVHSPTENVSEYWTLIMMAS